MRLLLDTHILLWLMEDSRKLDSKTNRRLDSAESVYISTLSLYEIYSKYALGKLKLPHDVSDYVATNGLHLLPFYTEHAEISKKLPLHHRDPFDRMMIAQAKHEKLTLVTHDEDIWKYHKEIAILRA